MELVPGIINAISSLVIVLVIGFFVVVNWIERLRDSKQRSLTARAKATHVDFCEHFGYNPNTQVSAQTVREILEGLAEGATPAMAYLRSTDKVFNKDKVQ